MINLRFPKFTQTLIVYVLVLVFLVLNLLTTHILSSYCFWILCWSLKHFSYFEVTYIEEEEEEEKKKDVHRDYMFHEALTRFNSKTGSLRIWSYCWIYVWFSFNLAFGWVKSFTCPRHSEFDYCQCALNYAYYICWMKHDLLVLWFSRTSWSKQKCIMSIWRDVLRH
jgi:hypothetical protein